MAPTEIEAALRAGSPRGGPLQTVMAASKEQGTAPYPSTAVAVVAFGVAFGFVEAAVVVYLRAALGFLPGAIPAHDPSTFGTFEGIEMARELATLVMIAAVGWVAGRTRLERLAWAAIVFGTWDIAYYFGLRLAIDWPRAFDTWDVLFLVPGPWVGPVWAPIAVSMALIVVGLTAARRLRAGGVVAVGPLQAAGALAGGFLVILSFLLEADQDGTEPWAAWPIFGAGMALALAAAGSALARGPAKARIGAAPTSMDPSADRRSADGIEQPSKHAGG